MNDVIETCDLGIPYLGLGLGLGIWSRVRVRARVTLTLDLIPNPNPKLRKGIPRSHVSTTSFLTSAGI